MNIMDSKDSMDNGQHRRSFGTPTRMSMSKVIVFPSAVQWSLTTEATSSIHGEFMQIGISFGHRLFLGQ